MNLKKKKKLMELRNYKGCSWCGKAVQTLPKLIIIKGKLQLTHLWFDRNLSCLPMV